jgi:DNA polymerase-3 subunit alpha
MSEAQPTPTPVQPPQPNYVSLHNHSWFSLLDGLQSPAKMVAAAKRLGMPSIALTDHGVCSGLFAFNDACKSLRLCESCKSIVEKDKEACPKCGGQPGQPGGVKPIFGMEGYFVNDVNVREKNEKRWHLTLWAKNRIGLKNLFALTTKSFTNGFYAKQRIDLQMLKQHREGLMAGSACAVGVVCGPILAGDTSLARQNITTFRDLFADDFYIEIMTHKTEQQECSNYSCNFREEKPRNTKCPKCGSPIVSAMSTIRKAFQETYKLSKEMGVKPIWTCDSHYSEPEDAPSHDVLLSVSTKDTIKNPNRFTFASQDFYLKPYAEAIQRIPNLPELLSNTLEVAAKVDEKVMQQTKDTLPGFELPPGFNTELDYLSHLVKIGLRQKELAGKPEYEARVQEELAVIEKTGYARYFLILRDLIDFANREGHRVGPGRGCFTPDNRVLTIDGEKPIGEVVAGDLVMSHDGLFHPVMHAHHYNVSEDVLKIQLEDGRTITCTPDHEIYVMRNGEMTWVRAECLSPNDDVVDFASVPKEEYQVASMNDSIDEPIEISMRNMRRDLFNVAHQLGQEALSNGRLDLFQVLQDEFFKRGEV